MDKTRILQQGEEAKFQIVIKDFDMEANDFQMTLIYGYRRTTQLITKGQMVHAADGKWYFTFNTDGMVGRVSIECLWQVPDTDYADGYRQETDEQYLCFVASTPCPQFISCPQCVANDHPVTYTRTEQSSIADEYTYLACADYDRILTCDNEILLVLKTVSDNANENENDNN